MADEVIELLAELEAAKKALDHYATHDGGCPAVRGRGEPCDCGLEAARERLRAALAGSHAKEKDA